MLFIQDQVMKEILKKIPLNFFIEFYNKIKLFYDDEINNFKHITNVLHNNEFIENFNLNRI